MNSKVVDIWYFSCESFQYLSIKNGHIFLTDISSVKHNNKNKKTTALDWIQVKEETETTATKVERSLTEKERKKNWDCGRGTEKRRMETKQE